MRIVSKNDAAVPPTTAQLEVRNRGMRLAAWIMRLLRGADATAEQPIDTRRPPCPFYGFVGMISVMLDNKGNACALAMSHSPCQMEVAGDKPCWDTCSYWNYKDNKAKLGQFLDATKVFPDELVPKDGKPWGGISCRDWFRRVMGRRYS